MKAFSRRDLARAQSESREGLRTRFQIRTETPSVATATPGPGADMTATDPTKDTLVTGKGVFEESRDSVLDQDAGSVRIRKGTVTCSARYAESFRKGYAVAIGGQAGQWNIKGVVADITGTQLTVYVESRQ
jgi:hypothetical protein